jgi:phospholipase/carboxylesterase
MANSVAPPDGSVDRAFAAPADRAMAGALEPTEPKAMTKRRFPAAAASIFLLAACVAEAETAQAAAGELSASVTRARAAGPAETGLRRLRQQGALLYVPSGYSPGRAAPLLVMLHGAGGNAGQAIGLARDHAERLGFLVLAPKSRGASWDIISGRRFGPDVTALDSALKEVFAAYSVDPGRVAVGGFSDGASYALSLGLINGELFSDILAFSPGFVSPGRLQGRPRIFISHGRTDRILPIGDTSRRIVPELKRVGYRVGFEEFAGGHEVPERVARRFFEALAGTVP